MQHNVLVSMVSGSRLDLPASHFVLATQLHCGLSCIAVHYFCSCHRLLDLAVDSTGTNTGHNPIT